MGAVVVIPLLLAVIIVVGLAAPLYVWWSFRDATRQGRDLAMQAHRLLAAHLADPPAEDSPGASQAVSDALACYDAATRQAMTARMPYEWEVVGLLCQYGLSFLGPFVANPLLTRRPVDRLSLGTAHPASQAPVPHQPSQHPTDETPYYNPGGIINGQHVAAGWYPTPWWSEAIRTGPYHLLGATKVALYYTALRH